MTSCTADGIYCITGCCDNQTELCCYSTCGGEYCMKSTTTTATSFAEVSELIGTVFGVIIFVVFTIIAFAMVKGASCRDLCEAVCGCVCGCVGGVCGAFADCFSSIKNCFKCKCSKCEEIDKEDCLKCLSAVLLCPCLFVRWLRTEWRNHSADLNTQQTQSENPGFTNEDSSQRETRDIYQRETRDVANNDNAATNYERQLPSAPSQSAEINIPIDDTSPPPSYHEATKGDPPSYSEAHQKH